MPLPQDRRAKPASVKVRVSTGEGVDILWSDDHASHYDFPYLRDHCPCATCQDERERKEKEKANGMQNDLLPLYKPKATAKSASPVGHYAIQIEFSDGHTTGIYSFRLLRSICPCPACRRAASAAEAEEATA